MNFFLVLLSLSPKLTSSLLLPRCSSIYLVDNTYTLLLTSNVIPEYWLESLFPTKLKLSSHLPQALPVVLGPDVLVGVL